VGDGSASPRNDRHLLAFICLISGPWVGWSLSVTVGALGVTLIRRRRVPFR
jgi:hypothetical protein